MPSFDFAAGFNRVIVAGLAPVAPGTFGSIPGVALALGLRQIAPWWAEGAALVLLFVAYTVFGLWVVPLIVAAVCVILASVGYADA